MLNKNAKNKAQLLLGKLLSPDLVLMMQKLSTVFVFIEGVEIDF